MHVGVLIKAYGSTKEIARERAERLLLNEQYVFEGNYDQTICLWDYPYDLFEDGERYHQPMNIDNYVESGISYEDFKKLGRTKEQLIKIFDFFGIAQDYFCVCKEMTEFEQTDITEMFEIQSSEDKCWFFIGTCHI